MQMNFISIQRKNTKTFKHFFMRSVVKSDRNLLVPIIIAYEFGQMINLPESLCNEIMPAELAFSELNGLLKSEDKSLL